MKDMKNKILTHMIREALDDIIFLSEDDDDPILGFLDDGPKPSQLSWLDGQGAQDLEQREAEKNKSFFDESEMNLPWDDRLQALADLLQGIALDVIDHYKGRPGFTKEAARQEILASIGVPLDIFLGDQTEFGNFYSLDRLLDEEFEDVNENYADLGDPGVAAVDVNDDSNEANMGDISEGYGEEEYEPNVTAEAIAALEKMHQNLEGIIDRLKEDPNAPLGTDIAMAYSGLDEALSRIRPRKK